MQSFRFSLERVLELRSAQMKVEEGKLQTLLNEEQEKRSQWMALQEEATRAHTSVDQNGFVQSSQLHFLEQYSRRIDRASLDLTAKIGAIAREIEHQRTVVTEAKRRVRLLEKLKERRAAEWQVEAERQFTQLADDFSAAQWARQTRETTRT